MSIRYVTALTLALCASTSLSAQAQDTLVLYTSQPNTDAQSTVDAFKKANPDIDVEWVRDGTTKLMTKLRAEMAADAAKADVLLIADSVSMESLKQDGQLQPYLSVERSHYDPALYDKEGYYYGTKLITTGIAYNTKAAMQPASWSDLAKPEAKGQVAMPSPLYSGAALIHLAALTNDKTFGWDYYKALKNNDTMAQGGNGGVLKALASGTKSYGMLVDYMAIREKAKGAPIDFVFPKEGVSMVTEPVAILKQAKHLAAAKKFVDFVLSQQGQQLVLSQGYIPAHNDMPVPEGFPARASIKLLPFDAALALKQAEQDKTEFADIFGAQ
ncbi:Fe(3+) ABC transporter substrate-binding protein [Pokkaliibacter plantistimulans]|uniref:Fe(3+) ABC transporter substrate-binding protein n=1 Tax=Proteobacteria bacterium 228 TaxID=2083153 RepID=A0A2S5KJ91_9PROT|nr:ABC transporter substrate-binding protein [Pokkaliibacter plantistimulans]PPC74579.1 Fe(3+) ABC transporter substrate-binding protein [Pokkaliibacter plantistimulans]